MTVSAHVFTGQGFNSSIIFNYSKSIYNTEISDYFLQVFNEPLPNFNKLKKNEISRNEISAAILCISSLEKMHIAKNQFPQPSFIAGYSVGQYLALHYAGCISREDAISIIFNRCKIMNKAALEFNSTLVAIAGLPLQTILNLIKDNNLSDKVFLSNDNAIGNYTFAVGHTQIIHFMNLCTKKGAYKVKCLNTTGGWHSKFMNSLKPELSKLLDNIKFREATTKIVDNTFVSETSLNPKNIISTLCNHLVQPVRWRETIKYFMANSVEEVLEISDFDLLTRMGAMSSRKLQFTSLGLL